MSWSGQSNSSFEEWLNFTDMNIMVLVKSESFLVRIDL